MSHLVMANVGAFQADSDLDFDSGALTAILQYRFDWL